MKTIWENAQIKEVLERGGIVVMPTDTLYGIVGRAEDKGVVERIYGARKRNPEKPCIILLGDKSDLEKFSINPYEEQKKILDEVWPGPVSVVLDCSQERFAYLHRGTHTLAFRLPKEEGLRNLLKKTGPIIAPSANIEGMPPSTNIFEAKKYFGEAVDSYVDGGDISGKASKVIKLNRDGSIIVLRA